MKKYIYVLILIVIIETVSNFSDFILFLYIFSYIQFEIQPQLIYLAILLLIEQKKNKKIAFITNHGGTF